MMYIPFTIALVIQSVFLVTQWQDLAALRGFSIGVVCTVLIGMCWLIYLKKEILSLKRVILRNILARSSGG